MPEEKITNYLLNLSHPDGWGKAQEFRNREYNESNVATLISDLIAVAQSDTASDVRETVFGLNYVGNREGLRCT